MKRIDEHKYEKEYDWEINSWSLNNQPESPPDYNLWVSDGTLYLSNDMDLVESIEITTKEELDELIARLTKAGKDVFK